MTLTRLPVCNKPPPLQLTARIIASPARCPFCAAAAQHADAAHFAKIKKRKQEAEEAKRRQEEAESVVLHDIRFQKGRLLGFGTFDKVFEAINVESGEIIAVKQIELRTQRAEETAKAAEQEIRMMEGLRHPNIVKLLGFSVENRVMNVIMEFVPGNSLDDVVQRTGALQEQLVRRYVKQILLALQYCHSKGVLHRDIKGKNILLGIGGQVKVADFGSAKIVENVSNKDDPSVNYAYTPLWVAPEVLTGRYNSAVDIWSVGCVVIELAAGREPWAEMGFESTFAALYFIASHKECVPAIPASLSAAGHDFIRCCLTRDPDRRPTAAQLLQHPFVTEDWEEKTDAKAAVEAAAVSGSGAMEVSASIRETRSATMATEEPSGCCGDEAMAVITSGSSSSSKQGVAVLRGGSATISVMLGSGGSCAPTMERTLQQQQPVLRMQTAMSSPVP